MQDCDFCSNEINYHEIIECIACALDAKDPYTAGHSLRVSDMALKVCQLIGLKNRKGAHCSTSSRYRQDRRAGCSSEQGRKADR